jgi:hypothetical protein
VFKRARWLAIGAAVGVGSSVWAQRKVKTVVSRYRPAGLAEGAASRAKGLPGDVRAALREGKATMREREAELRSQSETRGKQPPGRP